MPNKFQEAISEINRARKRIKTARKTFNKSVVALQKTSKLLQHGSFIRSVEIPPTKLAEIQQVRDSLIAAKAMLNQSEVVLGDSAKLLHRSGIRPYRKKKYVSS